GPDELVRAVKAMQVFNGLDPGAHRHELSMAVAVLVKISAYSRPIELLSLRVTDALVPTLGSPRCAIHLRRAERGQPCRVGLCD
ncbi:unnamed protein product, partial [Prorocentrum cordatum]